MTITEKVAYLKGLAEGLGLDEENKQEKLIKAIIDVLDDMALTVDDLEAEVDEMGQQVDEIDEDLAAAEEELYDGWDCEGCEKYDDEDEDDDGEFVEVRCPQCGETICIDPETLENEDGIVCPNCDTDLEFDFGDDEEDGDGETEEPQDEE